MELKIFSQRLSCKGCEGGKMGDPHGVGSSFHGVNSVSR